MVVTNQVRSHSNDDTFHYIFQGLSSLTYIVGGFSYVPAIPEYNTFEPRPCNNFYRDLAKEKLFELFDLHKKISKFIFSKRT